MENICPLPYDTVLLGRDYNYIFIMKKIYMYNVRCLVVLHSESSGYFHSDK